MGTGLKICLLAGLSTLSLKAAAQTISQLCTELETRNAAVTNGSGRLINSKAMNIFLAEKVASYLSDGDDLSLYKNSVRADMAAGNLSIDHNFHQPTDPDETVRSFTLIGARINFANAYASNYAQKYAINQLGLALQQTWLGKPQTHYTTIWKQALDAQRALLTKQLETELRQEANTFETDLQGLHASDVPGQTLATAQTNLRNEFYINLRTKYLQKFDEGQAANLMNSTDGFVISDSWTSAGLYAPIYPEKFETGYAYPAAVFANHTQFWTGPKVGRLYLTFAAHLLWNNSVSAGISTSDLQHFLTPSLAGKLAWLPGDSHVGISFKLEKNFGDLHTLNAIAGIPIVLIDKNGIPALNFEAQLRFTGNNTTVGLTIGFPFSKLVY